MWMIVALESGTVWPRDKTTVNFRGHELILAPETESSLPCLYLEYSSTAPTLEQEPALVVMREFLSNLAWVYQQPIIEKQYHAQSTPVSVPKFAFRDVTDRWMLDYLPDPTDDRARLALALYRKALGTSDTLDKFANLFRILNVGLNSGNDHRNWINSATSKITSTWAKDRLNELISAGTTDVGDYLWKEGRNAIVHTNKMPYVNPDKPIDSLRIHRDLPLLKELTELFIEEVFLVKSRATVFHEYPFAMEDPGNTLKPAFIG